MIVNEMNGLSCCEGGGVARWWEVVGVLSMCGRGNVGGGMCGEVIDEWCIAVGEVLRGIAERGI